MITAELLRNYCGSFDRIFRSCKHLFFKWILEAGVGIEPALTELQSAA